MKENQYKPGTRLAARQVDKYRFRMSDIQANKYFEMLLRFSRNNVVNHYRDV